MKLQKKLLIKIFTINIILGLYLFASSTSTQHISSHLLGVKYEANTLVGSKDTKEQLVIKLDGVDCFTFIDYVEAMKDAYTNDEFKQNLIETRYEKGIISFKNRRHFFSDWLSNKYIKDITCQTGPCIKVFKRLNKKGINRYYLDGIDIKKRKISYVKPQEFDSLSLKQGDYIGIYTPKDGLDVTHVGIAIFKNDQWYLRHASSVMKKVIDSELDSYLENKDGVIVYRSLKIQE